MSTRVERDKLTEAVEKFNEADFELEIISLNDPLRTLCEQKRKNMWNLLQAILYQMK